MSEDNLRDAVSSPVVCSCEHFNYVGFQPFLFHSPHHLCLLSFYAHVHVIHCHVHLRSVMILFMKLKMNLKCMLVTGMQFLIAEVLQLQSSW